MKKLFLIFLFMFNISFAAPTDCDLNPFQAGCNAMNSNLVQSSVLCQNGVIFQADGKRVWTDGSINSTPPETAGLDLTSATAMNKVCDNYGGIVAYMDQAGGLNNVTGIDNTQSGNNYLLTTSSPSGVAVSAAGAGAVTSPTVVSATLLADLPDWSGDGGIVWIPDDHPDLGTPPVTSSGTTSSGAPTKATLLAMTNDELADYASKNKIGACRLVNATACGSCACDYYNRIDVPTPNTGYPHGTGCSNTAFMCGPYGCCNSSEKTNGGCLIRYGINKGDCVP